MEVCLRDVTSLLSKILAIMGTKTRQTGSKVQANNDNFNNNRHD